MERWGENMVTKDDVIRAVKIIDEWREQNNLWAFSLGTSSYTCPHVFEHPDKRTCKYYIDMETWSRAELLFRKFGEDVLWRDFGKAT